MVNKLKKLMKNDQICKIVFSLQIIMGVFTIILYFIQVLLVNQKSYGILEEVGVLQFGDLKSTVDTEIRYIREFTVDYQFWDDLYYIMMDEEKNEEQKISYIKENLITQTTMQNYNFKNCIILNKQCIEDSSCCNNNNVWHLYNYNNYILNDDILLNIIKKTDSKNTGILITKVDNINKIISFSTIFKTGGYGIEKYIIIFIRDYFALEIQQQSNLFNEFEFIVSNQNYDGLLSFREFNSKINFEDIYYYTKLEYDTTDENTYLYIRQKIVQIDSVHSYISFFRGFYFIVIFGMFIFVLFILYMLLKINIRDKIHQIENLFSSSVLSNVKNTTYYNKVTKGYLNTNLDKIYSKIIQLQELNYLRNKELNKMKLKFNRITNSLGKQIIEVDINLNIIFANNIISLFSIEGGLDATTYLKLSDLFPEESKGYKELQDVFNYYKTNSAWVFGETRYLEIESIKNKKTYVKCDISPVYEISNTEDITKMTKTLQSFLISISDITKEKLKELSYSLLLDSTNDLIFIIDKGTFKIKGVNDTVQTKLKINGNTLVDTNFKNLFKNKQCLSGIHEIKNDVEKLSINECKLVYNKIELFLKLNIYKSKMQDSEYICIANDITETKRNWNELNEKIELENIILDISNKFMKLDLRNREFKDFLKYQFKKIGVATNQDRIYIFEKQPNTVLFDNTIEWCNKNITQQIDNLKNINPNSFGVLTKISEKNKDMVYVVVDKLNLNEYKADKQFLEQQDIKSLILLPIYDIYKNMIQFIGIDQVKEEKHWKAHIIKSLRLLRDIIQNYYHKKEYIVKLEEQKQFYKKLFENFDDTLYIIDNNYVLVDLNDEYMLKNQIISKEELQYLKVNNPQELERIRQELISEKITIFNLLERYKMQHSCINPKIDLIKNDFDYVLTENKKIIKNNQIMYQLEKMDDNNVNCYKIRGISMRLPILLNNKLHVLNIFRDMDQVYKQHEKEIEIQKKLIDILSLIPEIVIETDVNYNITYANFRASDIFFDTNNKIDKNFIDFIDEFSKKTVLNMLEKLKTQYLSTDQNINKITQKLHTKMNTIIDVYIRQQIIYNENGSIEGYVLAIEDITYNVVKDLLLSSRNTNRQLFEQIPNIIIRVKRDGTIVNYKQYGKDIQYIEHYLNKNISEILKKDEYSMQLEKISLQIDRNEVQIFQFELEDSGNIDYMTQYISHTENDECIAVLVNNNIQLQEYIEKLRTIDSNLNHITFEFAEDGTIFNIDTFLFDFLGYQGEDQNDTINTIYDIIYDDESKENVRNQIKLLKKENSTIENTNQVLMSKDNRYHIYVNLTLEKIIQHNTTLGIHCRVFFPIVPNSINQKGE